MNSALLRSTVISRTSRLEDIEPKSAWDRWVPSDEEPWNEGRIRFLYRRLGFGASIEMVKDALSKNPDRVIDSLFEQADATAEYEADSLRLASAVRASGEAEKLAAWWLLRMRNTPNPLREKMTLFWHGHFATGAEKVQDVDLMYEQNRVFYRNALGDFRKLAQEISKDPAMLIYLDSVTNRKAHPNENYARELMELFCLGEGNYTEKDVQELARCFTGWEIRRKQFRFNSFQHDDGKKTLFGQGDIESGETAVDRVVSHPAMPRFIVGKLFRFFLCDEPTPSEAFLKPLVDTFVKSDFELLPVVKQLLSSRLMLSMWSVGRKVRSPVELFVEFLTSFDATTNLDKFSKSLRNLGQAVFFPPNVKGWDGGRAWINSSTLIGRANLIFDLVFDENTRFGGGTLERWGRDHGASTVDAWIQFVSKSLFAFDLSADERERIAKSASAAPESRRWANVLIELANNPKIHLS